MPSTEQPVSKFCGRERLQSETSAVTGLKNFCILHSLKFCLKYITIKTLIALDILCFVFQKKDEVNFHRSMK